MFHDSITVYAHMHNDTELTNEPGRPPTPTQNTFHGPEPAPERPFPAGCSAGLTRRSSTPTRTTETAGSRSWRSSPPATASASPAHCDSSRTARTTTTSSRASSTRQTPEVRRPGIRRVFHSSGLQSNVEISCVDADTTTVIGIHLAYLSHFIVCSALDAT